MAKNPYMSAWLSAADKVANAARGQAMAAGRAEARRNQRGATSAWFDLWAPPGSKSKSRSAGDRKRTSSSSSTGRAKRR